VGGRGGFGQLNVQLERRQDARDLSEPKFRHTAVLKGVDGGATNLGAVRQRGLSEFQRLSLLCDAFARVEGLALPYIRGKIRINQQNT